MDKRILAQPDDMLALGYIAQSPYGRRLTHSTLRIHVLRGTAVVQRALPLELAADSRQLGPPSITPQGHENCHNGHASERNISDFRD